MLFVKIRLFLKKLPDYTEDLHLIFELGLVIWREGWERRWGGWHHIWNVNVNQFRCNVSLVSSLPLRRAIGNQRDNVLICSHSTFFFPNNNGQLKHLNRTELQRHFWWVTWQVDISKTPSTYKLDIANIPENCSCFKMDWRGMSWLSYKEGETALA